MSMYEVIHGQNLAVPIILAVLDLTKDDLGRFRDAFVADGKIAVYTRNGGGNRDCWRDDEDGHDCERDDEAVCDCPGCTINYKLPRHPLYIEDQDDDFDCTYATIYFRIPEEARPVLALLDGGKFDPDARWADAIRDLEAGKRPDVVKQLRPIIDKIVGLAVKETR